MACEKKSQRSECHTRGGNALGEQLLSVALPMYQEVIGATTHTAVPQVKQPSVEHTRVRVEVMESVTDGHVSRPQGLHEQHVPEVRASEVDDIRGQVLNRAEHTHEGGAPERFAGKPGASGSNRRVQL